MFNVCGVCNIFCEIVLGKCVFIVKLCESDELYLLLNDGYNWKGDFNVMVLGLGFG